MGTYDVMHSVEGGKCLLTPLPILHSHISLLWFYNLLLSSPSLHQSSLEMEDLVQYLSSEAWIPVLGCNVAP